MTSKDGETWGAIRLRSEAGVWYIARTPAIKKNLEKARGANSRAVFSRGELHAVLPALKEMKPRVQQEWLSDMITVQKNLINTRINQVKTHDSPVILSPSSRGYEED